MAIRDRYPVIFVWLEWHADPGGVVFYQGGPADFRGAYAVLPYVFQGAVEQYLWLTPGQMIDRRAWGGTTPGPLIMVVTFGGFVGDG